MEVEIVQNIEDAAQLGQHGASLRLGGMRGEHRYDGQIVQEHLHFRSRQPFRSQATDRGGDRLIHRLVMSVGAAGRSRTTRTRSSSSAKLTSWK